MDARQLLDHAASLGPKAGMDFLDNHFRENMNVGERVNFMKVCSDLREEKGGRFKPGTSRAIIDLCRYAQSLMGG